ncbi:hypothetical protein [Marinomonas profundimaris]|uniref:Uncharacterized protein n=1 Tax=Marinomonas profundimaris TaxID=1208321 RepID=W1RYP3_9GAMM|nr:hypothetical protein [Marinomonas profundimaris]ETI60834.1 hypothetical protein D104_08130 [Marinomonas profundimaris]
MNFDSRLTLAATVVAVAVAILAAVTLGLKIGHDSRGDRIASLETELQSYRDVNNLNLAETVESILIANKAIEKNISEIKSYSDWKAEEKKLASKISSLSKELDQKTEQLKNEANNSSRLKSELKNKQNQLDNFYPLSEAFWLKWKDIKNFSGFEKIMGIDLISGSFVTVNFQNKPKILYIGNFIEFEAKGSSCKLILSKINTAPPEAYFQNICQKTQDPLK